MESGSGSGPHNTLKYVVDADARDTSVSVINSKKKNFKCACGSSKTVRNATKKESVYNKNNENMVSKKEGRDILI